MNESSGGIQIFLGTPGFTPAQIDAAFNGGAIPCADTGSSPVNWIQAKKKQGATLAREGATIDLDNDVDGLTDVVISEIDKWTLQMDITQIDKDMFFNLTGLDPTKALQFPSSLPGIGGRLSYIGTSMLANGFPVLMIRQKYDAGNTGNVPKLGSGSDPLAWCWFKMVLADRKLQLKYDPKGQLILPITLKPVAVSGAVNASVAFWNGPMTKAA
jgi:hypothetical protein